MGPVGETGSGIFAARDRGEEEERMFSRGKGLAVGAAVLGVALFAAEAQALAIGDGDYTFDEGNPADGTILGASTVFPGLTITGAGTFAIICDTAAGSACTDPGASGNDDYDLITPNGGVNGTNTMALDNIVVVARYTASADGIVVDDPNDATPGNIRLGGPNVLTFTFDIAQAFTGLTFVDRESSESLEVLVDGLSVFTGAAGPGDGGVELAAFMANGATLEVKFGGSGGVAEIFASPVPVPAALPLFATALAGFGLFGWRKKKAQ
jgi:hypothetical protein